MTSLCNPTPRVARLWRRLAWRVLPALGLWLVAGTGSAMELMLAPAPAHCGVAAESPPQPPQPPEAARQRLPQSQAVRGTRDIAWTWLGSPTQRYPHAALGSTAHAGSLHVLVATPAGGQQELTRALPPHRVFEDRVPRLADLDGDGHDEIIVVESDALRGAALVVYGVRDGALAEVARGPHAGSTFRWLNPVGVADFDGDGRPDIASVTTPHIGGVLTLHHYRPPRLEPYARATDVSNHRMGTLEQQLAVIVTGSGQRPAVIVPDTQFGALQALRWDAPGQWTELAKPQALPARAERLAPLAGGGCLLLADATWWRVTLTH